MRELLSLLAIILVAGVVIGDRHHFDHHGRHHEDKPWKHHGKAPCPYPHKDVKVSLRELGTPKNETIVVDVSRKQSDENSVKSSLKVSYIINLSSFMFCGCLFFFLVQEYNVTLIEDQRRPS